MFSRILFFLLLSIPYVSFGQAVYSFRSIINNLPSNTVATDCTGRIWLGTEQGLFLFDGNGTSLPINELEGCRILTAKLNQTKSKLWIYTSNSFGFLDLLTLKFTLLRRVNDFSPFISPPIIMAPNNYVYTSFNDGLVCGFDEDGRIISSFKIPNYSLNKNAPLLTIYDNSLLALVNSRAAYFFKYNLETKELKSIELDKQVPMFIDIIQIGTFNGKIVLNSYSHGIHFIELKSEIKIIKNVQLDSLNHQNKMLYLFSEEGKDLYLLYQNQSLYKYKADQSLQKLQYDGSPELPNFFSHTSIEVKQNQILLASKHGLNALLKKEKIFDTILSNNISTRNIIEDLAGGVYIGTYKGLFHYNKSIKDFGIEKIWPRPQSRKDFYPYALWTEEKEKYVYIGSEGMPFSRFNKELSKVETSFYNQPDFYNSGFEGVHTIVKITGKEALLLGYQHGLAIFNMKTGLLKLLHKSFFNKRDLCVLKIKPIEKNAYLVCTNFGIFKLLSDKILSYRSLSSNQINDCVICTSGHLWVATESNGVYLLDESGHLIKNFTINDGLPSNSIAGLVDDKKGHIWISTQNGLARITQKDFSLRSFSLDDGLSTLEFNRNSIGIANNTLFFGSIKGVNIFDNKPIPHSSISLLFNYVKLWRFDEKKEEYIYEPELQRGKKIQLNPGDRIMNMSFGVSDISNIPNNQYQYRTLPLDTAWKLFDYQERFKIFQLPYGTSIIEIKGYNASHQVTSNIIKLRIEVLKPFYLRWWFLVLIFLLLAAIMFMYFDMRLIAVRKLHKQRSMIAKNIHDEVGGLLSVIQLDIENYKMKHSEIESTKHLDRILRLSKNASTSLYDSLWIVDSKKDDVESMLEKFYETAELLLKPIQVEPIYEIKLKNTKAKIAPVIRQQLYYIYKECLNNIVKHAQPHKVIICMRDWENTGYTIIIKNDGVKPSTYTRLTGMGLTSMQERADLIHYTVEFDNSGKEFSVIITPQP